MAVEGYGNCSGGIRQLPKDSIVAEGYFIIRKEMQMRLGYLGSVVEYGLLNQLSFTVFDDSEEEWMHLCIHSCLANDIVE